MKTKNFLIALLVAVLSTSAVYAQRVEVDLVDGYPVINCEGMPSSAYTTMPKGNIQAELQTNLANREVFKRFAVDTLNTHEAARFMDAFKVCSAMGSTWRTPTQRELLLLWILKAELEQTSGFTEFLPNIYWSGTLGPNSRGFCTSFSTGDTVNSNSTNLYRVRCVKEL